MQDHTLAFLMVLTGSLHALKRTARLVLVWAAIALPGSALAERVIEPETHAARQGQLLEQILEAQSRSGHLAAELIEPMTELALLYQGSGDHPLAIAMLERARQVVRVNYGLYSIEEAPLLSLLVRSQEALGNVGGAWELEHQLLSLAEHHRGHPKTLPIHREIGDRRLDMLERYVAGAFPPQIVLGCYYRNESVQALLNEVITGHAQPRDCRAGNRGRVILRLQGEVLWHYRAAADVMAGHDLDTGSALRDLEMSVVRALYASDNGGNRNTNRRDRLLMAEGGSRLRRVLDDAIRSEAPISAQIDALVQLADWHLIWWRGGRGESPPALEAYARAYEQLAHHAMPQATVEAVFSPAIPVVLPGFRPNPLVSVETPESTGWIDIEFDVTSHGRASRVRVLGTTRATEAQRRALRDLIRRSRFRPRVMDGELADAARVVLRYYVND